MMKNGEELGNGERGPVDGQAGGEGGATTSISENETWNEAVNKL